MMSTKHVRNAADLVRFKAGLRIDCRGCGSSLTLDGFAVAQMAGRASLAALQSRLRCSRFGKREAVLHVLAPPEPRH